MALIAALSMWVIDAAIDVIFFFEGSFLDYLILDVPPYEIYVRVLFGISFIGFSLVIARIMANRRLAQEELIQYKEQLEEMVANRTSQLSETNELLQDELSKHAQSEETTRLYREIVNNIPVGVHVWQLVDSEDSNSFRLIAANPAGMLRENIIGKTLQESFPAYIDTDLPKMGADVIRTGKSKDLGEILSRESLYADDQQKPVFSVKIFPLSNNCAGVLFDDITERKNTVIMLRELSQQFNTLLEAIPDSLLLLSPDLKIIWGNRGSLSIAKNNIENITGQYCYTLWHKSSAPCEVCPVIKSFQSGKEESIRTKAFHSRIWEVRAFPVKGEDGKVNNVLTIATDITHKLDIETESHRIAHLASIGELAAGIAHEINNPINGIINYAQILVNRSKTETLDAEISRRIIKEGDRIADIVKSLLSFARVDMSDKRPVFISEIMKESMLLTESLIRKDGINIQIEIPSDIPGIIGNFQQIEQVFLNIINNSRYALNQKYMRPHQDKILKITAEKISHNESPFVRIIFYDRGAGISSANIDKVINPFFTTKPIGKGTGLGLSISHGIITDHGGRINIESVEGLFTKLIIELPAIEDSYVKHSNN